MLLFIYIKILELVLTGPVLYCPQQQDRGSCVHKGAETQTLIQQVKPNHANGARVGVLVDVRQMSEAPVPVALQVEPVLSFVVRVWSLLKPPAEI